MIIFLFTFYAGFPDELRKLPTRFRLSSPSVGRSRSGCKHGQQVQVTPWWQHVTRTTSLELRAEASRWLQRAGWTTDREVQRVPRTEHRANEVDGRNRDSQWIYGSFFSQYSTNESSLWTREGNDVAKLYCTLVTTQEYRYCQITETNWKRWLGEGACDGLAFHLGVLWIFVITASNRNPSQTLIPGLRRYGGRSKFMSKHAWKRDVSKNIAAIFLQLSMSFLPWIQAIQLL